VVDIQLSLESMPAPSFGLGDQRQRDKDFEYQGSSRRLQHQFSAVLVPVQRTCDRSNGRVEMERPEPVAGSMTLTEERLRQMSQLTVKLAALCPCCLGTVQVKLREIANIAITNPKVMIVGEGFKGVKNRE
jgi:hypothetical protein